MSDQIKQEPTTGNGPSAATPDEGDMSVNGEEFENYEDNLDLDMSKEDTKVWLVRMPTFLMEKWRDVEKNSGKELGKVRISTGQANSNKKEVSFCERQLMLGKALLVVRRDE